MIAMLCIAVLVASLPLHKTEFVVNASSTSTIAIVENTFNSINEISQAVYSADNITVTSL